MTYAGHPLYRFAGDRDTPGRVGGQGVDAFGARWFVVGTDGRARTRTAPKAAPAPSGY